MLYATVSPTAYRRLNKWNNDWVQAGDVGGVGDANLQIRLKQSNPDMPMRYEEWTAGQNEERLGSNVQDGEIDNYLGNGPATVFHGYFPTRRGFYNTHGQVIQDLRAPDTFVEPYVSSLGDFSWRNKIAKTYMALRPGDQFLPLPGPYQLGPGELPRGGMVPGITEIIGSTGGAVTSQQNNMGTMVNNFPTPNVPGGYGGNTSRAGVSNLGRQTMTRTPREDQRSNVRRVR